MNDVISQLKNNNKLINIIRCYPQISKAALAVYLKVSWPTVSTNIEVLRKSNILSASSPLLINPDFAHMIGISVGSAQTKLTIIDMNFSPISSEKFGRVLSDLDIFCDAREYMDENRKEITNYIFFQTPDNLFELQTKLDDIIADIIKLVEKQDQFHMNIISIGIAFTGAIDNVTKKIVKSHNLEFLSDKPLNTIIYPNRLDFFDQKGINIYIDNNSNTSVVAEKYNMYNPESTNYKYRDKKNMLILYLGAGVGAGMIFNNSLYHGATNFVGELGHLELPPYPAIEFKAVESCCSCGSSECLDYRIRNDVFEMTKAEFSELTSANIKNYLMDNPKKFEIFTYYIGKVTNLLINLLNLDLIVFTGKFKEIADYMWPLLYKYINANKLSYIANECELKSSSLGPTAPSIGVAICAYFDKLGEDINWNF